MSRNERVRERRDLYLRYTRCHREHSTLLESGIPGILLSLCVCDKKFNTVCVKPRLLVGEMKRGEVKVRRVLDYSRWVTCVCRLSSCLQCISWVFNMFIYLLCYSFICVSEWKISGQYTVRKQRCTYTVSLGHISPSAPSLRLSCSHHFLQPFND